MNCFELREEGSLREEVLESGIFEQLGLLHIEFTIHRFNDLNLNLMEGRRLEARAVLAVVLLIEYDLDQVPLPRPQGRGIKPESHIALARRDGIVETLLATQRVNRYSLRHKSL